MKRRQLLVLFLLILSFSLGLTSFAQDGSSGRPDKGLGHHPPGPMGHILGEVDLTIEQRNKVHKIIESQHSLVKTTLDSSLANNKKIQELIKSGNFDLSQIRAIAENQANNHLVMFIEKERSQSQIYAVLTPEQQAKLDQKQSKFTGRKPTPPDQNIMLEMFSRRFSLSPEQESQIKTIFANQTESIFPLFSKLGEFHQQAALLTAKGQFDEGKIKALAKEYLPTMVDLDVAHATAAFNIYSVLNAEQREEFLRFSPFSSPGMPGFGVPKGARPPR